MTAKPRGRRPPSTPHESATNLRETIEARLGVVAGLERRASRHGDGVSYFVGPIEVVHFHGETRMDVRLTKERIPELRAAGRLDDRVRTRGPSAQWVAVALNNHDDVTYAVSLAREAVKAHA